MPERAAPLVLYVEDDRIHLILMEEVFRLLPGWDLRCAETGAEALAALRKVNGPALPAFSRPALVEDGIIPPERIARLP